MAHEIKISEERKKQMFDKQEIIPMDGKPVLEKPQALDMSMIKSISESPISSKKQIEIQPLFFYVLIKKEEDSGFNTSESGIILGKAEESNYKIGTVISVGKEVTQVIAGEKFLYHKAALEELTYKSQTFPLIREQNIICKIK